VVHEVFHLDRGSLTPDSLGLGLAEAKELLAAVQSALVTEQVSAGVAAQVACPHCGRPRRHKDKPTIVVRSLFGTLRLPSPRWWHCPCVAQATRTFRPLAVLLPERTTPELRYLESKFAGLVSYGVSATLLAELLPLGRPLHPTAIRHHAWAVAQRLEDEESGKNWGRLRGQFLVIGGVGEVGVPAVEVVGELVVEDSGTDLKQQVGTLGCPPHLLLFDHAFFPN
jgi:hypothetical protein